ncbi:MAG: GNAT family N-acetyltransferase [Cyclobacteriaceae bacterium]|nr:GNAT family N-acetyltransferase [Cyclobacteriaceae bacterium]
MEAVIIREATKEDLPSILQVAIASYEHTFAAFNTRENMDAFYAENYTLDKFTAEFNEPNSILFVSCRNNQVVGFIRLRISHEADEHLDGTAIELQRLYIHPEHQGLRAGALLIQKALEYAINRQFDWIWLGVWEQNFKAQAFYQKYGFIRFSEHVFQMGDDPQIDWLLKRRLTTTK